MNFTMEITSDGAAFEQSPEYEVADILRDVAGMITEGRYKNEIKDHNGNVVGRFEFVPNPDPRDKYRMRVALEQDPSNPRGEDHNVGTLVIRHPDHAWPREGALADEIDIRLRTPGTGSLPDRIASVTEWLIAEHGATAVLPVWGYDHGDMHLHAGERVAPFDDAWDSGFVGVIYDTPHQREVTGVVPERMAEALAADVADYDAYARGEVYEWVIEKADDDEWEWVSSAGGYLSEEDARTDGEAALAEIINSESP